MITRIFFTAVLFGLSVCVKAQNAVSDTTRQEHTIRLHNGTEVTETRTLVVTEEPVQKGKKEKKAKVKTHKPKNMEYRLTLLEVEFEVEKYRKELRSADEKNRKALLQALIDKVAVIKHVKEADYNTDYTQVIVRLPDESEYRVSL